ncbi:MAG: restriction endonuclease subunit S [Chitinophagales bacterium]|nr:restriction endonuclease subunit S [Chitinophagales bacterium]
MSWKSYSLGDILKRRKSIEKLSSEKEYKLVTIKLHHKGVALRQVVKGNTLKSAMFSIKEGDFILSGIDARNGAFGVVPKELDGAIITNDFWCLMPDESIIDKDFLLYLTSTEFFDHICKQSSDGTTQRIRLQKDKFFNFQIDLPSIDEQKNILHTLKKVSDLRSELANELTHQLTLVKSLRQQLLQDAVQGKLVAQHPEDEPASVLLEKIKAEKEKLIAEKKIKKEKPLPPIKPEDIPFEIPEGWVWCRLGEICDTITKGSSPKWQGVQYVDEDKGILFVTSKNVDSFKIDLTKATYVEEKFNEIEPRSILRKGDLLTNIVGASIGRTALFDLDIVANINQAVCILRIEHNFINKEYLLNVMNSDFALKMMFDSQFAPGRANLSMGNIASFPIPLPPLSEQTRIVQKLEALMQYCDGLEAGIRESVVQNERLLQQVLREALRG